MADLFDNVYFEDGISDLNEANLSIASSAVLYGLSVYTVFAVNKTQNGLAAFRLRDHFNRLIESSRIMGIDSFESDWNYEKFEIAVKELVKANDITEDVFVRVSVHVNELVPGTRSRGLKTTLSMFMYSATPIVPKDGVRLKTSVWRRVPDYAIPARAKVNGAYVNSVLAKQDAIDSGYDDCIFLDAAGHVCELSAANIFLVKNDVIITPDSTSDLLEGINRKTIIELAQQEGYKVEQRTVDLTELYIADEVFACGTSAFVASVVEVDARRVGNGERGPVTEKLGILHDALLHGKHSLSEKYLIQV
jgi:branched-chain amino acid aminotransferase